MHRHLNVGDVKKRKGAGIEPAPVGVLGYLFKKSICCVNSVFFSCVIFKEKNIAIDVSSGHAKDKNPICHFTVSILQVSDSCFVISVCDFNFHFVFSF